MPRGLTRAEVKEVLGDWALREAEAIDLLRPDEAGLYDARTVTAVRIYNWERQRKKRHRRQGTTPRFSGRLAWRLNNIWGFAQFLNPVFWWLVWRLGRDNANDELEDED